MDRASDFGSEGWGFESLRARLASNNGLYIELVSKVLLTGFQPFHRASSNPSEEIVNEIVSRGIPGVFGEVLPVIFGESAQRLLTRIEEVQPDVVISLGQAEGRTQITPERIAINLDDARIADNAGNTPSDTPVITNGANALFSTLPVKEIVSSIQSAGIPSTVSLSAGTFVCNHIFYHLQNYTASKRIKSGFIHVPLMDSQESEFPGLPTMVLTKMVEAILIAIEVSRR